jgi:hypothetical protein
MAEHIVEEKKILRFVNTGFRVAHYVKKIFIKLA